MTDILKIVKWSQDNPNYTYIATWAIFFIMIFVAGFFAGLFDIYFDGLEFLIAAMVILFFVLPMTACVLQNKNRSLLWLVISLSWWGVIIILLLKNKSEDNIEVETVETS